MSEQPSTAASLLVRLDSETRSRLKAVAASSDRTLSQLVRSALRWWIDSGDQVCPLHAVGESSGGDFVNVRFGAPLMEEIQAVAEQMGIERAGVIRCAVRAWLTVVDASALGSPLSQPSPAIQAGLVAHPIPSTAAG